MGIERRALLLLSLLAAACQSEKAEPPPQDPCGDSKLVVGIQGQPGLSGIISSYRATATIDGVPAAQSVFSVANPEPLFPHEVALAGTEGKRLDVRIDGFNAATIEAAPAASDPPPLVTRIVNAPFQCATKLVRVRLEAQCLVSGFAGAFGPTCTAPQSCVGGRCVDGTLLPQDLEPYAPTWADDTSDICKPPGGGSPEVLFGTGQTDFHTLPSGPIQLEKGPQGGHHLWVALRMKNLKRAGSRTILTAVQPGTGLTVPETSFVFTFDPDEGGYCKLFGLRYQLDNGGAAVEQFLGKPLDVTLEVRDSAGASAKTTAHVDIADTVIVPAGL